MGPLGRGLVARRRPELSEQRLHPRRLVFLGTPDAAVPSLRALVAAGYDVALVVTQPDRKRGRGGALVPSPVKAAALELGLPVTSKVDDALAVDAELGVVVAFGRLVKPHVLDALPMINVHFSLLPRWRGAAPVERAILAGDEETGVCIMQLEEGLDTGPVHAVTRLPIEPDESAEELRGRLVDAGTTLLLDVLTSGIGEGRPQDGEPTYAAKIDPSELAIDWTCPAIGVANLVRLGSAWTTFRGKRLKVQRARPAEVEALAPGALAPGPVVGCGDGSIELLVVQPEGKASMAADAWARGAQLVADDVLGS